MKAVQQKENQNLTQSDLIAQELFKLNLIIEYPYSDEILEGMAKTLIRLLPDIQKDELSELMDKYLLNKLPFHKEGAIGKMITSLQNQRSFKRSEINRY